jgi:hypothetical protein
MNKESNYSLEYIDNFNDELEDDVNSIIQRIADLFIDYFKFTVNNINLKKNSSSRFIIIKGLDIMINVFNHILFYTKNVELTYFHCQKTFYYYAEFIDPNSDNENTYLRSSSRDASLFIYERTIFELNITNKDKYETISDSTKNKLDIIQSYINIYKIIMFKLINNDFFNTEKLLFIENIYNKLAALNYECVNSKLLNDIMSKLYERINNDDYFFNVSMLIVKQLEKKQTSLENCNELIMNEDFIDKLQEQPNKFVKWLLN